MRRFFVICFWPVLGIAGNPAPKIHGGWQVEQQPGGTVTLQKNNRLEISDAAGCTIWWKQKLQAPVTIRYSVRFVFAGGPHDRISDANCFFMAQDPAAGDGCPFGSAVARSGKFAEYDSLRLYYVGMGGNNNTTTRFRRYAGDGAKPLLPGHDLTDARYLLQPDRDYRIEIRITKAGRIDYRRDGELFFSWTDPSPLTEGWFGLRTVQSHQIVTDFRIDPGS